MFFDQRIVLSDNGVLTDVSVELNDFRSGTKVLPMVAGEDYLYIGTLFPWSARFFEIGVANAVASVASVELYDNGSWVSAVDKIDLTSVSGASLAQSGYIRFLRNIDRSWTNVQKSSEIAQLAGTFIYDMYWLRIGFSASLTGTTSLKFIGQKFSSDSSLYGLYPDLNQAALKSLFASGKTTWDEQHYLAAQSIVCDLKSRKMVFSADQVLDPWSFELMAGYKAAEIIYGGLGTAYIEQRKAAGAEYLKAFNKQFKNLDVSLDGTLSRGERNFEFGRLIR